MKMRWYETSARYVLGIVYIFGAIDGAAFLFFDLYIHGKPPDWLPFLLALQHATYFWAFMKALQLIGSISLLLNYKPALGNALLLPISCVMCLFYVFDLQQYISIGVIVAASTIILCRAYWKSYVPLFDDYPKTGPTGVSRPA